MSDELETVGKVTAGGGLILAIQTVWRAFIRKGERDADRVDHDRAAKLEHFEKSLESHRGQLEALKQRVVELDTRLKFREGAYGTEPLTNPGTRPSAAIEAMRAEHERAKEGESR